MCKIMCVYIEVCAALCRPRARVDKVVNMCVCGVD